ncbi:MAG: hypothetical protein HZA50_10165 [Planctomycetes bacterium]|nr:hypothetical protein [Planctomycetota bacterium]
MVSRQGKKRERAVVRRRGPIRLRLTLAGWLVLGVCRGRTARVWRWHLALV